MVNAIFDDENAHTRTLWSYPDTGTWDAQRNTDEFVAAMAEYQKHGLGAVTVNLQGGAPGWYYRLPQVREHLRSVGINVPDDVLWAGLPSPDSQPWHNSAFDADGNIKRPYLDRLTKILDRADELGMVAILGLFYQGQDERLRDERAVRHAVEETCGWLQDQEYTNVVLEINNECNTPQQVLQPHRVHELIEQTKGIAQRGRRLLVSTSYGGGRVRDNSVVAVADFLLLHGNGVTDPSRIGEMIDQTRKRLITTQA